MSTPPAFGPTETFPCDENSVPFATVRLDLVVSRDQLRTAIAIGHAEMGGEPDLGELSTRDIRHEVEGHLAAGATIELYRQTAQIVSRLAETGGLADIDAAIDRAYTRTERPDPPRQDPRYAEGTVTLQTLDHGEVTVPEPAWCLGHDDENVSYLADLTHNGRPITSTAQTASHGPVEVAQGFISHAPHAVQQPEPHPTLYVALDLNQSFGIEDGRNVTRALRVAATRFDRALTDLDHLRGEGQ